MFASLLGTSIIVRGIGSFQHYDPDSLPGVSNVSVAGNLLGGYVGPTMYFTAAMANAKIYYFESSRSP